MNNLDFLKEILMSKHEYWVVAKKNESRTLARTITGEDYIILTCIPYSIRRGLTYEEITLKDLEDLQRVEMQNIYLNTDYPPFQTGQSFYEVYKGFPITSDVQKFLIKSLSLESNRLWDYKELIEVEQDTNEVAV